MSGRLVAAPLLAWFMTSNDFSDLDSLHSDDD